MKMVKLDHYRLLRCFCRFCRFVVNNTAYKYKSQKGARVMNNKFEQLLELLVNEEQEKEFEKIKRRR